MIFLWEALLYARKEQISEKEILSIEETMQSDKIASC